MEKLCVIVLMLSSILATFGRSIPDTNFEFKIAEDPSSVEKWFESLPQRKKVTTKLHFYFYDIVDGPNPTAVTVAQASSTPKSTTAFGLVQVMGNALTDGPDRSKSKIVGHAQGIYAAASLEEVGLLMTLNFVFADGPYKGSTLSVLGHNPVLHQYRERAVVGGSGFFRLTRGIATARTVSLNGQNAVVEYNVIAVHY